MADYDALFLTGDAVRLLIDQDLGVIKTASAVRAAGAELLQGAQGLIRGAHGAAMGAGKGAYRAAGGGVPGVIAGGMALTAPPLIAAGLANEAAGDPVGAYLDAKKQQFRSRLAQTRAIWDPRTGMAY
jgi:hypothetical protein